MSGDALEIIDHIASEMIATGGWEDADAGFTTAGTPPGRVLRYKREGEELFIAFVFGKYGQLSSSAYQTTGILVFACSGWDAASHIPSGTTELMDIPMYDGSASSWYTTATMAQLWLYAESDIVTILTQSAPSARNDAVAMLTIEREAAKEYDDGGSNMFLFGTKRYGRITSSSQWFSISSWDLPSTWTSFRSRMRKYIHPFVCAYPETSVNMDSVNFEHGYDYSHTKLSVPVRAMRSNGNSKVYMAFPVAYADAADNTFRTPIKTLKSFFPVEPGKGIADGDLINIPVSWNGGVATTWQYIYKSLNSPDSGSIDVAIKYGEV